MRRRSGEIRGSVGDYYPRVTISLADWQRIMAYVDVCETEIHGFGFVDQHPLTRSLVITEPVILDQVASGAHVEADSAALHKFMFELVQRGEATERLRFQWHSHVNMAAYFSATDIDNINGWPGDALVSLVVNKREELECRLDLYSPFRVSMPLELQIVNPGMSPALSATARHEVEQKVRTMRGRSGNGSMSSHLLERAGFGDPTEVELFDTVPPAEGSP